MAKSAKVTYTYNGFTFSTASKVVAKRAAAGNMEGAYKRYISDTLGRQLRKTDMSKALRKQYLRGVESGLKTVEETLKAKKEYEKQVSKNIAENIKKQYRDVFDQLRDSKDATVRKIGDRVGRIIEKYSDRYKSSNNQQMLNEVKKLVSNYRDDISEEGLRDLEQVGGTLDSIQQQISIRDSMRNSRLKKRKRLK